jgi:hypothetical protein
MKLIWKGENGNVETPNLTKVFAAAARMNGVTKKEVTKNA